MRLENFEIHSEIELRSQNLTWELHNFADFLGLELIAAENQVAMRWKAPSVSNPWGCFENKFAGMTLRFKDLQFLQIGPRERALPLTEDTCIANVLKVDPDIENVNPFMRTLAPWNPSDSFRLVFQFQSGRMIEIEAESVELVPVG